MVWRLFLSYVVVELAVLYALAAAIGLGRTLLVLLVVFVVGVVLAGSQAKRQLVRLRSGSVSRRAALNDGASVALATVLVIVPGLVTSAAGLLLLFPPTRAATRPLLLGMAARTSGLPLITVTAARAARYAAGRPEGRSRGRGDYIDGEVLDVTDVESPAVPRRSESA